jgi:hypothetical protein
MVRIRRIAPALFLLASAGCTGDSERELENPATVLGDDSLVRPRLIAVEGCLTAADDRFVLTGLDRAAAGPRVSQGDGSVAGVEEEPTTESYRLIGAEAQLRPLTGQRIEVTGSAEPERVVDVRETSPVVEPRNAGASTTGADARISTLQTTRIEIGDLRVNSVAALGEPCAGSRR